MITLTTCLAPACAVIARRKQQELSGHDYAEINKEIDRLSGPKVTLARSAYDRLCSEIFQFAGATYTEPSGFGDDDRFKGWLPEHDEIIPLLEDLQPGSHLSFGACFDVDHWFKHSGFVDEANDMTTLNAVRSVISAAVNERGGIVVS